MTDSMESFERIGPNYSVGGMQEARNRTMAALEHIAAAIHPGMNEDEGERAGRKVLKEHGLLLGWHKVVVRFGCNTVLPYGAPSIPNTILQESDIFTLDIGPIWQEWEGDGGDTFVVGNDPEMLKAKRDVKLLWDIVHAHWQHTGATGGELYDFTEAVADQMGWILNRGMPGHRVADFPHLHPGSLEGMPGTPTSHRWILEVLIKHKTLPFGAYYEDLMVSVEHSPSAV
ncbi:M24 family metallopeptidase [Pseudomonas monteilii]|uniref:M24 family metallopeptidase n=1 Tax=Pseudomonas monteilii TaxID=76759 RepID=UPI00383BA84E